MRSSMSTSGTQQREQPGTHHSTNTEGSSRKKTNALPFEGGAFQKGRFRWVYQGAQVSVYSLYIKAYSKFKPTYGKIIWGCEVRG